MNLGHNLNMGRILADQKNLWDFEKILQDIFTIKAFKDLDCLCLINPLDEMKAKLGSYNA